MIPDWMDRSLRREANEEKASYEDEEEERLSDCGGRSMMD